MKYLWKEKNSDAKMYSFKWNASQKDMIRVVVNKEGEIFADVTGKKQGRGAYVSKDVAMVEKAQQKEILENILKHLKSNWSCLQRNY